MACHTITIGYGEAKKINNSMRAKQFITLLEYKAQYDAMLKLPKEIGDNKVYPQMSVLVYNAMESAKKLKRNDIVVWYLRGVKYNMLIQAWGYIDQTFPSVIREIENGDTSNQKWLEKAREYNPIIQKEMNKLRNKFPYVVEFANSDRNIYHHLVHFMDLPIPTITNTVFDKQDPEELFARFEKIEEAWKEKSRGQLRQGIQEGDKMIIEYGGDKAWWMLNRGGCSDEGQAMGHCGNGAGRAGQKVLSFRSKTDMGWKPHLTFVMDEDGYLGEMKGRGNDKPAAKYHPFIVDLLKHDVINGIKKGNSYMPENDFSISDLEPDVAQELIELKPELITPWERLQLAFKQGKLDELSDEEIENLLKESDEASDIVAYRGGHVVLEKWKDIEDLVNSSPFDTDESGYRSSYSISFKKAFESMEDVHEHSGIYGGEVGSFLTYSINDKNKEVLDKALQNALGEEYDPDESTESMLEYDDADHIRQAVHDAIYSGQEAGISNAIYEALTGGIEDFATDYGAMIIQDKKKEGLFEPFFLVCPLKDFLILDEQFWEDKGYHGGWINEENTDNMPHIDVSDGWDDFSDDAANERLSEELEELPQE